MSEVIIKKNGTDYPLLTMPNHYPADRVYLDGDTTKTVQDAIERGSVSVTADGVKTRAQLYNELFALIDITKVSYNSKLSINGWTLPVTIFTSTYIICAGISTVDATTTYTQSNNLSSNSTSFWRNITNTGATSGDRTSEVVSSGTKIEFIY